MQCVVIEHVLVALADDPHHDALSVVEGLCDTITVLARGQVLAEGDYATVSKHPDVVAAYLGSEHA